MENKKDMDSSIIGDEEEDIKVSGQLAFTQSDNNESDSSLNNKPLTLSEHFNLDRDQSNNNPIFGTGKAWISKLSSKASHSYTRGRRKSSLGQSDGDLDCAASPSKPIGHWPDLLVMDKSENTSTVPSRKINGKNRGGVSQSICNINKV